MVWTVEFLNKRVVSELEGLPEDMQARFIRVSEIVCEFGPEQTRGQYVKHLQGDVWEIRFRGRDGIARALFVIKEDRTMIILRVFKKKTQKTPSKEIALALRRAKEVLHE